VSSLCPCYCVLLLPAVPCCADKADSTLPLQCRGPDGTRGFYNRTGAAATEEETASRNALLAEKTDGVNMISKA